MCIRHLGLVLLISFPGVLHAQSATQACSAPTLDGGIFLPKQQAYSHGTELTYTCDDGRKPTVKGWWATSTCQNGKWSHEPQCIDEAACLPPEIPNAKYTQSSNGWYEEGRVIRTRCDTGYEHKNQDATAECNNGIWSSVPVCEKNINACGVPPKVPHAVIIHQGYQEVFAPDSEVQYQCEDGYTVKGAHNNKSIFCISGQWTEGPTCTQSATQACSAPTLDGGIFLPKQQAYSRGTELTYTCDDGRKPTVKGWWATSTCQNGKWSHEPQCIDEAACLPPEIPNAKYTQSSNGWYEEGRVIRTTCDTGYEHKNWDDTTFCTNGIWSPVPVCEKSISACGVPPKVPHAAIIHQGYQEVFAPHSEVQYQCEDGYTVEGAHNNKSVFCISGQWTEGPTCSRETRPGTGHGGSTVGGTGGGHTTSADSREQPGGGAVSCGRPPVVHNGNIVETFGRFLRYKCASFYRQVGPESVVCNSDGTWSDPPVCKADFCTVDTNEYPLLKPVGLKYVKHGETERLDCVRLESYWWDNYSVAQCNHGTLKLSRCCNKFQIRAGSC